MSVDEIENEQGLNPTQPVTFRLPVHEIEEIKRYARAAAYHYNKDITYTDILRELVKVFYPGVETEGYHGRYKQRLREHSISTLFSPEEKYVCISTLQPKICKCGVNETCSWCPPSEIKGYCNGEGSCGGNGYTDYPYIRDYSITTEIEEQIGRLISNLINKSNSINSEALNELEEYLRTYRPNTADQLLYENTDNTLENEICSYMAKIAETSTDADAVKYIEILLEQYKTGLGQKFAQYSTILKKDAYEKASNTKSIDYKRGCATPYDYDKMQIQEDMKILNPILTKSEIILVEALAQISLDNTDNIQVVHYISNILNNFHESLREYYRKYIINISMKEMSPEEKLAKYMAKLVNENQEPDSSFHAIVFNMLETSIAVKEHYNKFSRNYVTM